MKLKVLPPTLRKNNRYLTVDIKAVSPITKDNLVSIVWDACIRFQGELNTANFNLWVMRFFEMEKTEDYYHYKSIIRCQRGFVDDVRSSLALVICTITIGYPLQQWVCQEPLNLLRNTFNYFLLFKNRKLYK